MSKSKKPSGKKAANKAIVVSAARLRLMLPAVMEELGKSSRARLTDILPLFSPEGTASLAACVEKAFPGKTPRTSLPQFNNFRADVDQAAQSADVGLFFMVDDNKTPSLEGRTCWFSPSAAVEPVEADLIAHSEAETDGLLSTVENPGVLLDLGAHDARPCEVFVSYCHDDHREVARLIRDVRTQLKAWSGSEFPDGVYFSVLAAPDGAGDAPAPAARRFRDPLIGDWELRGGQDWDAELRAKLARSHLCLALVSPGFSASDYIGRVEIPHFLSAGKPVVPVPLFPVDSRQRLHGLEQAHRVYLPVEGRRDGLAYSEVRGKRARELAFAAKVVEALAEAARPRVAIEASPAGSPAPTRPAPVCASDTGPGWEDKFIALALAVTDGLPVGLVDAEGAEASLDELVQANDLTRDLPAKRVASALKTLEAWVLQRDTSPFFAVLGELGVGKTTTLKQLARLLVERRRARKTGPLPIYVDLRYCGEIKNGEPPRLDRILGDVLAEAWKSSERHALTVDEVKEAVRRHGAVIIFDGLDEKLVHLSRDVGQRFIFELWKILPDAVREGAAPVADGAPRGKMIVSCRTQYFQDVWSQRSMLTGHHRETVQARHYQCLIILPFTEPLIREFLVKALGAEEKADAALGLIREVHNLSELARRPLLLRYITGSLARLELARARGARVLGVTLYEGFVHDWLERDEPKHSLSRNVKLAMMEELAAELTQARARQWESAELERWLQRYLAAHPEVKSTSRRQDAEVLFEDLRTATFVLRPDDSKKHFRFAHTSLQEYFHARWLLRALDEGRPAAWEIDLPSLETLDFVGQLLAETPDPARLRVWGGLLTRGEPCAARVALRLWLIAVDRGYPEPELDGPARLEGLDLEKWQLRGRSTDQPLQLRGARLGGARLAYSRWENVFLADADLSGADCAVSEWTGVDLSQVELGAADFAGAVLRECRAEGLRGTGARWHEAELSRCDLRGAELGEDFDRAVALAECETSAGARRPADLPPALEALIRSAHGAEVTSCAWSPDGQRLASGSEDKTVRVWDAESGKCLRCLVGHENGVCSCTWSPDGRRLASGSEDKTVRVWDAESGRCLRILAGHENGVCSCAWSPDGRRLASASDDKAVRVWDAESGKCLRSLVGHENWVFSCAWSPDGRRLASASSDKTVRVWDAESGRCLRSLVGHEHPVSSCAWSPNGRRLASGSWDDTVRVWDAESGKCLRSFAGHKSTVWSCAWSPDGRRLASASGDQTVRVWDAESGKCLRSLAGHGNTVRSCAWSPDGRRLASGSYDQTVRAWDAESGKCLRSLSGHENPVYSCAWSPDGRRLASGSEDKTVRVWDADSGRCWRSLVGHEDPVTSCAWSPDGRRLASASGDKTVRVWDAESGKCLRSLAGHDGSIFSCDWSPDGRRLASASGDKTVRVWDAESGKCLRSLAGHENGVLSCDWSPDGRRLASASGDQTVRVWDVESGECLRSFVGHGNVVSNCGWSPDGRRLVSASSDKTVRVWDAESGKCLRSLVGHENGVWSCTWSSDGRRLASASDDNTVRVWDAESGKCLRSLNGHENGVWSCGWSPDGRRLASASDDKTVRVWDAESGAELSQLAHFPDGEAAALDGPGNRVLWASPGAWRHLAWRVYDPLSQRTRILPAEFCGPLPGADE